MTSQQEGTKKKYRLEVKTKNSDGPWTVFYCFDEGIEEMANLVAGFNEANQLHGEMRIAPND